LLLEGNYDKITGNKSPINRERGVRKGDHKSKMPTADVISQIIERNHFAALREFAQARGSELLVNDEMIRVSSGLRYPLFNFVVRPRFTDRNVDERIRQVKEYFRLRDLPFLFFVHPSSAPPNLRERLEASGFRLGGSQDGMALLRVNSNVRINPGVQVEVASTPQAIRAAGNICASVFQLPDIVSHYMTEVLMSSLEDPAVTVYLARVQGIPAATCTLVVMCGGAGLYNVATLSDYRGRGVASTLLLKVVQDARALGQEIIVGHVGPEAARFYWNFGFSTYFKIWVYTLSRPW